MKKPTKPVAGKTAKTASGEQKSTRKAATASKPLPKASAKVAAAKKPTAAKVPAAKLPSGRVASSRVVDLRTSAGVAALNKASKAPAAKSKPATKSTAQPPAPKSAAKRSAAPRVIDLRTAAGVAALNKASKAPAKESAAKQAAAPRKVAAKPATKAAKPQAKTAKAPPGPKALPKPATGEVKAKRSRVPADLAAQYGEKATASTRVAVKEEGPLRKPRRTAAARAKLQQALKPDEGILARLERAKTAGMTKKRVPSRRSKNWRARCGRCGVESDFSTAAGLCPKCGAILMRGEE